MGRTSGLRRVPVALVLAALLAPAPVLGLRRDEQVIFFPTLGYRVGADAWELRIHGWVFEPEQRRTPMAVFQSTRGRSACDTAPASRDLLAERARAFLVDNEHGKRIAVRLGARELRLAPSDASGHVVGLFRLGEDELPP